MVNYDNVENDVEDLKKQVWYLTKTIAEIQNGGSGSSEGGGNSSGEWTTLYDKTSDDPTINLGKTNGICGSAGQFATFPDLLPFNFLRVQFTAQGQRMYYYYDITNKSDNNYRLLMNSAVSSSLFGMSFTIAVRNGKALIEFGNCTKLDFFSSKYTTITNLKDDYTFAISKMEGKQ